MSCSATLWGASAGCIQVLQHPSAPQPSGPSHQPRPAAAPSRGLSPGRSGGGHPFTALAGAVLLSRCQILSEDSPQGCGSPWPAGNSTRPSYFCCRHTRFRRSRPDRRLALGRTTDRPTPGQRLPQASTPAVVQAGSDRNSRCPLLGESPMEAIRWCTPGVISRGCWPAPTD